MKKKILFLTHVGSPGGAEYKMIELCQSEIYDATVLHFQNGLLEDILKDQNIPASILPMPENMASFKKDDGIKGLLKAIPATLSMVSNLAKESKKHDVIICISQKSFILASLAKPFTRKPIVWLMNDILSPQYFSKTVISIIKIMSRLTASQVILNSNASIEAWNNSGASQGNTNLIYPGVNIRNIDKAVSDAGKITAYKNKFSPDEQPLIGIFGRISPWKGQDVFLKAVAKIKGLKAIIVGDALFGEDEYKNSLIELTRSLGIEDRVIFTGHLDDVPTVMAACDIVAHCSTLAEPFGLVTAEATVVRTPVIATDAGGSKEIIEHNERGQLTPMGDHNALANAIQFYLDNPDKAKEFAQNARQYTEAHFSNRAMKAAFIKVLEKTTSL